MKIRTQASIAAAAMVMALAGCADMTPSEKGTVAGAAVGGLAGSAITGSTAGAVGGAVVGGVIGHEVGERREGR